MELLINEALRDVNQLIFGDNCCNYFNEFRYEISKKKMQSFLSWIYKWEGLKYCAKIPSTYGEYEIRSRNWMIGRRSKRYSNTLYAAMIQSVLSFSEKISLSRFPADNQRDKKLQLLYHNILIHSFSFRIFSKKIRLDKATRGLYLISEDAIKAQTTTKTKSLLQKHVINPSISSVFPSSRSEAIDYFEVIYSLLVQIDFLVSAIYKIYRQNVNIFAYYFMMYLQRKYREDNMLKVIGLGLRWTNS